MTNRRQIKGITTVDMSAGYARYVEPRFVITQFYMLGDHGLFCPIVFR